MLHRMPIWLLVVVFLLPILSCARLEEAPSQKTVSLGTEKLPAPDSIPVGWGKLVSVTTTPIYQDVCQLWFQDENGKVRMVPFNIRNRFLVPDAVVIPRK